jgi:hypothetical protein
MIVLILTLALLGIPVPHSSSIQGGSNWRTYRGAWFEINYPANFRVHPSQPSNSSTRDYDSVFFTAPDGSVEFYVFSPQWNGTPGDIEIDPQTELLVSRNVEQRSGKSIRRVTVRARDGSYLRSFEDAEDLTTNTRKVFGIRYANTASYNRYRAAYLTFKASLTQFAD